MQWFLKRIGTKTLPISFGISDTRKHREDFAKLVKKGVLKRSANLESVPCDLCDDDHECQVRENDSELSHVCENGGGKKVLADEELAIYEYDNDAFLKLIADELGIHTNSNLFSEVSDYADNALYRLGTYTDKKVAAEVYYLRTDAAYEPSSFSSPLNTKGISYPYGEKQKIAPPRGGTVLYREVIDTREEFQ